MTSPRVLWLVYCATVLWISSSEPAKTNDAECRYAFSSESQAISVDSRNASSEGYETCVYEISAPSHYFIQLNFTSLFGFVAPKLGSNTSCAPVLLIDRRMDGRGNTTTIDESYGTPYVFQSNSDSIQIIYKLNSCPRESGFTLSFNFLRKEKPCAFLCDGSRCLPAGSVCDGTTDCADHSDEDIGKCVNSRSEHIPYIVIVAFVVLITLLGVIVCFVKHNNCRLMSRIRQRHAPSEGQLRPQSQNSESLVPSPTQEQLEQQVSLLRERYSQINAMMRDSELGYPPQVQRSKDGEEGYRESQKDILSHRQNSAAQECFRPPPNRTVHDTESPPPYYSDSTSRSFDSYASKTPPSLRDYNGCPVVIRCYSLSGSASGESHPDFYSNSYSRTHSSVSVGNGAGNLSSGRPPPRYENYNSNSAPTAPTIMNGQSRGACQSTPEGEGQGRGSRSSSVRSSPPDYHNAFSVTSANMYRSTSDKANV